MKKTINSYYITEKKKKTQHTAFLEEKETKETREYNICKAYNKCIKNKFMHINNL